MRSTEPGFAILKQAADEALPPPGWMALQTALQTGVRSAVGLANTRLNGGAPPMRVAAFLVGVITGAAEILARLGGREMAATLLEDLAAKHREGQGGG